MKDYNLIWNLLNIIKYEYEDEEEGKKRISFSISNYNNK